MFAKSGRPGRLCIPTLLFAVLPKAGCPLCWAPHLGLASSAVSAYFSLSQYFGPLTVLALGVNCLVLARQAIRQRRYGALVVAAIAGVLMFSGRRSAHPNWEAYAGAAFLVASSVWGRWPHPRCYRSQLNERS